MASVKSYPKLFRAWDGLVDSCNQNASALPGMEPLRDDLAAILTEVKTLKNNQENLEGARKALTQQLADAVKRGEEAARKVRLFTKVRLGTDNERLTQFGSVPRRKKGARKPKTAEPPPQAAAEKEKTAGEAPRNPTAP